MRVKNYLVNKILQNRPVQLNCNIVEEGTEFDGKCAVVFGGGSGIGYEIANELKNNGATVVVCGRHEYQIKDIFSEIIDLTDFEILYDKLRYLTVKYGKIDIVVNSQGVCPQSDFNQDLYAIDYKDFDVVMSVNLKSVYFINQFFCRYFEDEKINGNILNICSTEGKKGCIVPYGISKAGVISLTKGLGKKMISKGIVINGIAPGATATQMMRMKGADSLKKEYIPSKRVTMPIEIAKVAHLLLSDCGRQMCGEIVTIDGGESLH